MTTQTKIKLSLIARAKRGPVTIDDAREVAATYGLANGPADAIASRLLRKPTFRPVGWRTTSKPSRHGRPIRVWVLA